MSGPVNTALSTPLSLMTAILITPPELPSRDIANARAVEEGIGGKWEGENNKRGREREEGVKDEWRGKRRGRKEETKTGREAGRDIGNEEREQEWIHDALYMYIVYW